MFSYETKKAHSLFFSKRDQSIPPPVNASALPLPLCRNGIAQQADTHLRTNSLIISTISA